MKLLITGAHGQLGRELVAAAHGHELYAVDAGELDITDPVAVEAAIADFGPDAVINAAAYTAVDKAESEHARAYAVNGEGVENLASACNAHGAVLVHVSTDYVFDGRKASAYKENDTPSPLGVYGNSKLAGELAVLANCSRYYILRTSWLFSSHGQNFVKTILRLAAECHSLGVVSDQHGCPTAAAELARGIIEILMSGKGAWGIYHFCQPEPSTWYGFAVAIVEQARKSGMQLAVSEMKAISTLEYPAPAARPKNSVLDRGRFERTFDFRFRPWRESLVEVVGDLADA